MTTHLARKGINKKRKSKKVLKNKNPDADSKETAPGFLF